MTHVHTEGRTDMHIDLINLEKDCNFHRFFIFCLKMQMFEATYTAAGDLRSNDWPLHKVKWVLLPIYIYITKAHLKTPVLYHTMAYYLISNAV